MYICVSKSHLPHLFNAFCPQRVQKLLRHSEVVKPLDSEIHFPKTVFKSIFCERGVVRPNGGIQGSPSGHLIGSSKGNW